MLSNALHPVYALWVMTGLIQFSDCCYSVRPDLLQYSKFRHRSFQHRPFRPPLHVFDRSTFFIRNVNKLTR